MRQRQDNGMRVSDMNWLCIYLIYWFFPNNGGSSDIPSASSFSYREEDTMMSILMWDTKSWLDVFGFIQGYPRWRGERFAITQPLAVYPHQYEERNNFSRSTKKCLLFIYSFLLLFLLRSFFKPITIELNKGCLELQQWSPLDRGHPLLKRLSTCILNGRPGRQQLKTESVWWLPLLLITQKWCCS